MARLWRRRGVSPDITTVPSFTEAGPGPTGVPVQVARRGLDSDIPMGGTTTRQQSTSNQQGRKELMDQLYGAYLACPWSSACVDTIAKTVTAGGVEVAPDEEDLSQLPTDGYEDPRRQQAQPKPVLDLLRLVDYVNPREDIRQLMRGVIADLEVYGDSFTEVVWLLGQPAALFSLDAATMIPVADEHGEVEKYIQVVEPGRTVEFAPHEVIHVSMDTLRGGVYGISPTQKLMLPITNWLFTEGLLKETMRKGNPPRIHFDWPVGTPFSELERFQEMYGVKNLGIANIGNPITSRAGATPSEFKGSAISEYLLTLDKERDTITSGYGVPNRKVGIAEAGSLGGAGAEVGEDRTFQLNTCAPDANLVMEKFNFLLLQAFGIAGWSMIFGTVDWRDDDIADQVRDRRIRNATLTINKARAEIGEPPIEGGDVPILVDRQNLVAVPDLVAYSKAGVAALQAKASPTPELPDGETPDGILPAGGKPGDPAPTGTAPAVAAKTGGGTKKPVKGPAEEAVSLDAAWDRAYQQRRRRALKETADVAA